MADEQNTEMGVKSTPKKSTRAKTVKVAAVGAAKTPAKPRTPAKKAEAPVLAETIIDIPDYVPHQDEIAGHAAHTDIDQGAWIMRHVPDNLKPYALLMRLDRPIGLWLLLLPCFWGLAIGMDGLGGMISHFEVVFLVIAFTIGAVLMRGAGCIINDLWDRDIDLEVERTRLRPIASGAVSPDKAILFLGILLAISAFILFTMNWATIAIGIIGLVMSVMYPLMKRVTFWPQAFLGLTFNLGILMGCTAVTGHITSSAFIIYLGAVAWTIAYDTIYARQDIEDDLRIGVKSTPILFGENLYVCVAGFMVVAVGFLILGGITGRAFGTFYAVLALPILHAFLVLRQWQPNSGASCLASFKAQRDFGLLVLLALLFI